MRTLGVSLASICLFACGGDGVGSDAGGGTSNLLVRADVDVGGDSADLRVRVERAGQDVDDAIVTVTSDGGEVTLALVGGGDYRADQAGWNDWYDLEVRAGDDWVDGGIESPEIPVITDPSSETALDPHTVDGGEVRVAWTGESAMSARVRVGDFETSGDDEGELMVPAAAFNDGEMELSVERTNSVDLAGGAPGSHLSAHSDADARIFVTNPF